MHTIYAVDCWDLEGASVDKCGPMFPSAPQNLTATSSVVNRSTVMLWISWSPPARYNPDITMYAISINRGQGFCTNGVTADYSYISSYLLYSDAPIRQFADYPINRYFNSSNGRYQ